MKGNWVDFNILSVESGFEGAKVRKLYRYLIGLFVQFYWLITRIILAKNNRQKSKLHDYVF